MVNFIANEEDKIMVTFWKDKSKKQIDPELFSATAEKLAKEIAEDDRGNARKKEIDKDRRDDRGNVRKKERDKDGRDHKGSAKKNNPSQIRKFYDEVLKFKGIIEKEPDKFNELLPYIKMLNAKAAYALGRDLISEKFKNFITDCLKQIDDKDDFDIFANLFEAFMGYYKFYRPSEGGK